MPNQPYKPKTLGSLRQDAGGTFIFNAEEYMRRILADEEVTDEELRGLSRITRIARDTGALIQVIGRDSARRAITQQVRFKDAATVDDIYFQIGERRGLGAFGWLRHYGRRPMERGGREYAGYMSLGGLIDPHELYTALARVGKSEESLESILGFIRPRKMEETALHEGLHAVWFQEMSAAEKRPFIEEARKQMRLGGIGRIFPGLFPPGEDVRQLMRKSPAYEQMVIMARMGMDIGTEMVATELFAHRGAALKYDTTALYEFTKNAELDKEVSKYIKATVSPGAGMVPEYVGEDPGKIISEQVTRRRFVQSYKEQRGTFLPPTSGIAFNRAINPIEGMQKGGIAEVRRKAMTDFGSPYRRPGRRGGRPLPTFLEEALQRSTLLDIETAGLDPTRKPIISAAQMKYGAPEATTTFFEPEIGVRVPSGRRYAKIPKSRFEKFLDPWPEKMWEEHWKGERADWLAEGATLERPGRYFSKLATKTAETGNILWAHNVHFDITRWASQYMDPEAMGKYLDEALIEPWYPQEPRGGKIFPTLSSRAWKYRRDARLFPKTAPGQMRGFYGEMRETLAEAVRTGKPMIADSMLVAQSVLGMGQGAGYLPKTLDVATGSSLEALHYAYLGRGYGAHRAAADVEALANILPDLLGTAEALYEGAPLRGYEARALYRLGAMQPRIAQANIERTFAQAKLSLQQEGRYALMSRAGEQVFSKDYKDILSIYEERYAGLDYQDIPSIKGTWEKIGIMEEEALGNMLKEKKLPKLGLAQRIGAQWKYAQAEGALLWSRVPAPIKEVGAFAAVASGLAYALWPGEGEEEPGIDHLIHGLGERGSARNTRRHMTDFGSGWRGDTLVPMRDGPPGFGAMQGGVGGPVAEQIDQLSWSTGRIKTGTSDIKRSIYEVDQMYLMHYVDKMFSYQGKADPRVHGNYSMKANTSKERFYAAQARQRANDMTYEGTGVPNEALMMMEAESKYSQPFLSRKETLLKNTRFLTRSRSAPEAIVDKLLGMETAGNAMAAEVGTLQNEAIAKREYAIELEHAKEFRAVQRHNNTREYKHAKQLKAARMTTKTMERYAPLPISGVRMFDSPGVPGMVQRIHATRKRSQMMYNR